MQKKTTLALILFLFSFTSFSQQKIKLTGKVKSENFFLAEALLELQIKKNSMIAVSNSNGDYQFLEFDAILNDTIVLKVNYQGYKTFRKTITIDKENIVFDISLEKKTVDLNEVVIQSKSSQTAEKLSYKINQNDFIKNAKATDVLKTIPTLFYSEAKGAIVEGNLKGKILIDGIEVLNDIEIKQLKASQIERVEVINNPTSAYGTDFLGAIINIISKKSPESFFKGSVEMANGFINKYIGIGPTIAYKKDFFSFKTTFQHSTYNQIHTNELKRINQNSIYTQNSSFETHTNQNYYNGTLNLEFSKKSNLTLIAQSFGLKTKSDENGVSNMNNTILNYSNLNNTTMNNNEIHSIFTHKFSDSKTLYIKSKFNISDNLYESTYKTLTTNSFYVKSKNQGLSTTLNYSDENKKIFNKKAKLNFDLKYVNRDFNFSNTNFFIIQNIFNATTDINIKWTKLFSTQTALTFEHSSNKSNTFLKNYNLILPTFNALYKFKNKTSTKLGFSTKILRPGISDLNETFIITSPTTAEQGNSNLNQQKRNYYFFSINKQFENDYAFFKIYRNSIKNSIIEVYKNQGDLLVRTFENALKNNSTGVDLGYTTKILKRIDLNLNSGISYDVFETDGFSGVLKENKGISLNNSINLSSKFFKDKVSMSLSGYYTNPEYTLLSKTTSYPSADFTINTNLLKDKLALILHTQNLFGNNTTIRRAYTNTDNFNQTIFSKNNGTNILLSLTYNFGKDFENNLNDIRTENNDLRK